MDLCLFWREFDVEAIFFGIPVRDSLDSGDLGILLLWLEEVAEPLLGLEVLGDRLPDNLLDLGNIPVHHLDRSGRPNDRVGRDLDDEVVGSGRSRNNVDESG